MGGHHGPDRCRNRKPPLSYRQPYVPMPITASEYLTHDCNGGTGHFGLRPAGSTAFARDAKGGQASSSNEQLTTIALIPGPLRGVGVNRTARHETFLRFPCYRAVGIAYFRMRPSMTSSTVRKSFVWMRLAHDVMDGDGRRTLLESAGSELVHNLDALRCSSTGRRKADG